MIWVTQVTRITPSAATRPVCERYAYRPQLCPLIVLRHTSVPPTVLAPDRSAVRWTYGLWRSGLLAPAAWRAAAACGR